jgi:galactokinase
MDLLTLVETKFAELYGSTPLVVRSPGRVNLIGEHTDYNMGYVLPAAIGKSIFLAVAPNDGTRCRIFAVDMNDEFQFTLDALERSAKRWPDYLMGVVDQLLKHGYPVKGFDCVFGGDIPIGAGLSSSAALEAGLAFALNRVFGFGIDKLDLVKLAQKAENEFVGVRCGIMDQYINIFGEPQTVLRIDCRTLEHAHYPFKDDAAIVLFNTGVSHSLASSEYNKRRQECTRGVEILQRVHPGVSHLRDVTLAMLHENKELMDATTLKRCVYVVEENARVIRACDALQQGDLSTFGELMFKSHEGLSRNYEVSCAELDFLVDAVRGNPDVYGARMMGGGFGGCTINLVRPDCIDALGTHVRKLYKDRFGFEPEMYVTSIGPGTALAHKGTPCCC